ncbi:glycosyltransferase family 2 protein [Alkalicoccus halolimnae]|uniref:Glycosyltransferase family A protein n=1 Tax=Alkalicoccus halolimnae TaxID=1667239 RepID=A0AAJ8N278_9BACI|nr:glycosyltransferase family A protein [Alkalicoccus halolimnae]
MSLICTVKNGGELFQKTLDSIAAQTDKNFEIVFVNDGSTDQTGERIEQFIAATKQRAVVITTTGIGRGKALNAAVQKAGGTHLMVIDADDPIHPRKVELQAAAAELPYAVIAAKEITILNDEDPQWDEITETAEVKDITERILIKNPVIHSTTIISKEDLLAVGGYDETRKSQFDYELWLRFVVNGYRLAELPYYLTAKRIHDEQSFEKGKRIPFLYSTFSLQWKYLRLNRSPVHHYAYPAAKFAYGLLPRSFRMARRQQKQEREKQA